MEQLVNAIEKADAAKGDAAVSPVKRISIPIIPAVQLPVPVSLDLPEQASFNADAAGLGEAGADSLTMDNNIAGTGSKSASKDRVS